MTEITSTFETRLKQAFQAGLSLPPDVAVETLEFAKSSHWDSIAHFKLISALENAFNIMIETNDMLAMSSFIKAKEIVRKYDPSLS